MLLAWKCASNNNDYINVCDIGQRPVLLFYFNLFFCVLYSAAVRQGIVDTVEKALGDPKVKSVVICGQNGVFCGGMDGFYFFFISTDFKMATQIHMYNLIYLVTNINCYLVSIPLEM